MHRPALACALLLVPLSARSASPPLDPPARTALPAKVVAYASGTAFAALDPEEKLRRVRLVGVDAPERRQRFAPEARSLAAQWLGGRPIEIAVHGTDQDGRLIGRVVVDGRDVALALIDAGLAWCHPADDRLLGDALRSTYADACAKARSQRVGLWQEANPVPPWEYRRLPEFDGPAVPRGSDRSSRDAGQEILQRGADDPRQAVVGAAEGPEDGISSKRGSDCSIGRPRPRQIAGY